MDNFHLHIESLQRIENKEFKDTILFAKQLTLLGNLSLYAAFFP